MHGQCLSVIGIVKARTRGRQELDDEPSEEQERTREEWMILSDLNTPFDKHQTQLMTGILTEPIIQNNKSMKCLHG